MFFRTQTFWDVWEQETSSAASKFKLFATRTHSNTNESRRLCNLKAQLFGGLKAFRGWRQNEQTLCLGEKGKQRERATSEMKSNNRKIKALDLKKKKSFVLSEKKQCF